MGTETAVRVPEKARKILRRSISQVAMLMPDGSSKVASAQASVGGDEIVVTTTDDWPSATNLRDDSPVAIAAIDPDDPDEAVVVRGWVSRVTHDLGEWIEVIVGEGHEGRYGFGDAAARRARVHVEPSM
jgi:hypothetical protein